MRVDVLDQEGQKVGHQDLDPAVFEAEVNQAVMHQVVVAGMAAARRGTHATKTRSEVRGGGRKPWRQKGTGRARHGSIRSPLWVGGGIAHGPKPRKYAMRIPKKMKRLALRSALSDAATEKRIKVIDALSFDAPSTKAAVAALRSLEVTGRVLVVTGRQDQAAEKSFRNIPDVKTSSPGALSTYDVLAADWVVFVKDALGEVRP